MILRDIYDDLKAGDVVVCRCGSLNSSEECKECGRIYVGEIIGKYGNPSFKYASIDAKIMRNDCLQTTKIPIGAITYIFSDTKIEFVI